MASIDHNIGEAVVWSLQSAWSVWNYIERVKPTELNL